MCSGFIYQVKEESISYLEPKSNDKENPVHDNKKSDAATQTSGSNTDAVKKIDVGFKESNKKEVRLEEGKCIVTFH